MLIPGLGRSAKTTEVDQDQLVLLRDRFDQVSPRVSAGAETVETENRISIAVRFAVQTGLGRARSTHVLPRLAHVVSFETSGSV